MPIFPFIFAAIAGAALAYGAKKGYEGIKNLKEAQSIIDRVKKEYEDAYNQVSREIEFFLEKVLAPIGRKKIYANELRLKAAQTLKKALSTIKTVEVKNLRVDENISIPKIDRFVLEEKKLVNEIEVMKDSVKAVGTSALAYIGATGMANTIGVASTGTAINALSGAAAKNAMLAWFGGGSLAAGGGGMALGSVILGAITVAPTVLFGGLMIKKQSEKALTEAKKIELEVLMEMRKLKRLSKNLRIAQEKAKIYEHVLDRLTANLERLINEVEELLSKTPKPELMETLEKKVVSLYLIAHTLRKVVQTKLINPKDFKFTVEAMAIIKEAEAKLKEI